MLKVTKTINLQDVKQALLDSRFRESLPVELNDDVQKFLKNPGCSCNHPIYKKIMKTAAEQLAAYYPTKQKVEAADIEKAEASVSQNEWTVISCHIDELVHKLRALGPGRKQLDIARWQDQVTIVINELDVVF